MNYQETVSYLFNSAPVFEHVGASAYKPGLQTTKALDEHFNHPHTAYKTIHIAGTNGKGSCSHSIAAILQEAGYKVGLYTSPHLVDFRERIRVNGEMIPERRVIDFVEQEREFFEPLHPSFFELTTALAFLYFKEQKVDVAVIEVGLGGRLDCTNVFTHPLLTIITSISLEHTEYLGDTIEKIAAEKAGIIKQGVPVLYDAGNEKADQVISTKASACQAKIYPVHRNSLKFPKFNGKYIDFYFQCDYDVDTKISIPFAAPYQMMNMTLAYQAMRMLEPETGIKKEEILKGIRNTRWQGRMQEVGENIYFDGAHNVAGIHAFLDSVALIRPQNPILLFSMVSDKDYEKAIQLLAERGQWEQVIVTTISDKRGIPAEDIARIFSHFGQQAVVIEDSRKAYEWALKGKKRGQALFCTGSLYFIGELLEITGGKNSD